MAYNLEAVGGYGLGILGNVTNPVGQICSYANVITVTEVAGAANAITIGVPSEGVYEKFAVGSEIFMHASACIGGDTAEYLGRYIVAKIIGTQESSQGAKILLLSQNVTELMPVGNIGAHVIQAITIPQFDTLSIDGTNMISPIAYDAEKKYGGVLPIKCKTELKMADSARINLVDMGIPMANKALRYWTKQECANYANTGVNYATSGNGFLDTDPYSGWENHMTEEQLLLNAGDGACAIWAQKITNMNESKNTRIGGAIGGVQFCRGGNYSMGYNRNKPADTHNLGGSSILMVANSVDGFVPSLIAKYKYKGTGWGLGRCCIALRDMVLRNDEGLYAFDTVSNQERVAKTLNVKGFGSGVHGSITNPTAPLNNYAAITDISIDGKTLTWSTMTTDGIAKFTKDSLVLFQVAKHKNDDDMESIGKIMVAKVLHVDTVTKKIVLDSSVATAMNITDISKYTVQLVSILETATLTISTNYTATAAWNGTTGGVCAIACTEFDLENGQINVENKGGGTAYGRPGLAYIGNAQMKDRLPVGQGHGSVFLLVKNMKTNANSRIGGTQSGAGFGGTSRGKSKVSNGGGYCGSDSDLDGVGGSGHGSDDLLYSGGIYALNYGGYGSSGKRYVDKSHIGIGHPQGAHIFGIIEHLDCMRLSCFSTGGGGSDYRILAGSGYGSGVTNSYYCGGGGGYNGGGSSISGTSSTGCICGGSSGWCFLYVNSVDTLDDTGVKI